MMMDPREFELIAIGHVLARYRATGTLPTINGEPFNLDKFKSHLSAGVDPDTDTDIDVAIINNTIINEDDDKECEQSNIKSAVVAEPEQPKPESVAVTEQEQPKQEHTKQEEPTQESTNPNFAGKLFQFFNRDER
jgi:hypothetical protein